MAEREVIVAAEVGLHARPAAELARAAGDATRNGLTVTVRRPGDTPVNAASIVSLMTLGARHGETLVLEVVGDSAEETLDRLAAMVAREEAN